VEKTGYAAGSSAANTIIIIVFALIIEVQQDT
jgi:hypothetical protein